MVGACSTNRRMRNRLIYKLLIAKYNGKSPFGISKGAGGRFISN
jgi:hypothetical protein